MDFETLKVARDGYVVTITIDRPKALNALNTQTLRELKRCLTEIHHEARDETRVIVLTGAGEKAFVAGADISEMVDFGVEEARAFSSLGHRVFDLITAIPFPVIAAVNGYALGGGCELMLACDLAYASKKARFGQPEVNLGVTPGFGGTQRLIRRIGLARARELIYTGEIIDAERARDFGLVNDVFEHEELMERTCERAKLIASKAPLAIAQAKRVTEMGYDEGLRAANQLEQQAFGLLFGTEDMREGMRAFLEKRTPEFRGR
ncbi:MAG: enoyl-CoA hydratase/isomerase family protein [Deltaproteobacteria bacterium]|nr:MAG: enoyl-CoA hydratase/isomerase family protein [Deltaproteobacteria bacterium]